MNRLSNENRLEIIEKYLTGKYSMNELGRYYGVTHGSIRQVLLKNGIKSRSLDEVRRKYTLNQNYFDIIDTEDKAYFLGLLYADGCNFPEHNLITISLQEEDIDILEKFRIAIGSNRPLRLVDYSHKLNHKNQIRFDMSSNHMSQQLTRLGCVKAKSLILEFPTEEQVPYHLIRHFIRGMWDGDGYIYTKISKRTVSSLLSTMMFCKRLSILLENIGIKSKMYRQETINKDNVVSTNLIIKGRFQNIEFLDWLYKDSTVYLNRKYLIYKNLDREPEYTAFGETKSFEKWANDSRCVVNRDILKVRIRLWNDMEAALSIPKNGKYKKNVKRLFPNR